MTKYAIFKSPKTTLDIDLQLKLPGRSDDTYPLHGDNLRHSRLFKLTQLR